jgi:cytochrome b561
MSPGREGYSATAKWLHWLIVALVLSQFVVAVLMPDFGPRTVPGTLVNLHLSLGLLIFLLTAVRFVNRQFVPVPLDDRNSPEWQRLAARAMHLAFYVLLLLAPFLGWAAASAHRVPVTFFGLASLPPLAPPRARWALRAGDIHSWSMWVLLALIALHAAVALYHHFVRKDEVLRRMLPSGAGA